MHFIIFNFYFMNPNALHPQHFTECSNLPWSLQNGDKHTKRACLINYAVFCEEENLLCDYWIFLNYNLEHSFSCHSKSNWFLTSSAPWPIPFKSHSWTEFWISLNLGVTCQCLHLINCWYCNQLNLYLLSHFANLFIINFRTCYCHICMYKYKGYTLICREGIDEEQRQKKREFIYDRKGG